MKPSVFEHKAAKSEARQGDPKCENAQCGNRMLVANTYTVVTT